MVEYRYFHTMDGRIVRLTTDSLTQYTFEVFVDNKWEHQPYNRHKILGFYMQEAFENKIITSSEQEYLSKTSKLGRILYG